MSKPSIADVGALNEDLQSSLIIYDDLEDAEIAESGGDRQICYFNGVKFDEGDYVRSGDDVLRCERGGVWVRKASYHDQIEPSRRP